VILELIYGGAGAAFRRALCRIIGCRDTIVRPREWRWLHCERCFSSTWWK